MGELDYLKRQLRRIHAEIYVSGNFFNSQALRNYLAQRIYDLDLELRLAKVNG